MAVTSAPRVVVASAIRDLAKHVQKYLPTVTIKDIHYNAESFSNEQQLGEIANSLQEVQVLLCDGDALLKCLDNTPKLKWAQITWAGVDYIMKQLDFKKPSGDIILTRTGQGFGELMAEYVIGQIIARERNFAGMRLQQEQRKWNKIGFTDFRPLYTLSVGILGFGVIGKEVAAKCKSMGMTVWAVGRTQSSSSSPVVDQFRGIDALEEVLQNCDYLCNILPHTPGTQDLLSGDILRNCEQKKSVLINIGRGSVISDESLIRAVEDGWLGGAIIDVFNEEPLPADSQLWSLPNIVISPHVSGPSLPDEVAKSFAKNFKLYMKGQPLQNVVDWDKGY